MRSVNERGGCGCGGKCGGRGRRAEAHEESDRRGRGQRHRRVREGEPVDEEGRINLGLRAAK